MDRKTIIFDFDGTLADTFSLIVDTMYQLANAKRLPAKKIAPLRRLPLLQATRALGISIWRVPRLTLLTRRRMFARMQEVKPFPGIPEAIRELDVAGYDLCILTSNHERNVRAFLRANNFEQYFSDIVAVFYGNVFFKIYGLHKLMKRNKLKAENCYYVGNEALDMRAAELSGLRAVATTWGGHDRDKLAATKPFAILDDPKKLLELEK